jgi:hypothetical protein
MPVKFQSVVQKKLCVSVRSAKQLHMAQSVKIAEVGIWQIVNRKKPNKLLSAVHKQVPSPGHYKLTVYNHAHTGTVAGHWQTLLLQSCTHRYHSQTLTYTPEYNHSHTLCCSQTLINPLEYNHAHTGTIAGHLTKTPYWLPSCTSAYRSQKIQNTPE